MSKVLNDTQRKLVEDNHKLIFSFLNNHNLSLDAVDDWYGTAAIGLCKAALTFDESRGIKFTTLAYVCMDNEVRHILRKNRKNIISTISLNTEVSSECENCFLIDAIPDNRDCYNSIYLNDAIESAICKLSDRNKEIIDLIVSYDMTSSEIASKFGVSRQAISLVYCRFIKSIRDYFKD